MDGAEHHRHVAAVLQRRLLDDGELRRARRRASRAARCRARGGPDLATAEHDRDLDLVLALEEALDVTLLGVVVVLRDLRAELDLTDRDLLLVLARRPSASAPARTCTSSSRAHGRRADARPGRPRPGRDRAPARTSSASGVFMTPIWLPSSPIRRTSGTRMRSLIRVVVALRRSPVEPTWDRH